MATDGTSETCDETEMVGQKSLKKRKIRYAECMHNRR